MRETCNCLSCWTGVVLKHKWATAGEKDHSFILWVQYAAGVTGSWLFASFPNIGVGGGQLPGNSRQGPEVCMILF